MTVAVAHQDSATARLALAHAVQEAAFRDTDLAVLHVVDSALDADREEAYRLGVSDEIERAVGKDADVSWKLHLKTRGGDIGDVIVNLVDRLGVDLLVLGARRRSPVGKALLGSVAQTIILEANVPVLVVKAPPRPGNRSGGG
jgi:nucleotide-binding universal stress UspA family protein